MGDFLAFLRKHNCALMPLDKLHAKLLFECFDLHGERRLGNGNGVRGFTKMQMPGKGTKIPELP